MTRAQSLYNEIIAICVCIGIGLTMAMIPPVIWWTRDGQPVHLADLDEVFYLAVGSQAYFNHPTYLSDPARVAGGKSLYPQLPLLPGVWISRVLGLGPVGIDLTWRILAGVTIPLGWYVLMRQFIARRWLAVALVAVMLTDGGLLGSSLFVRQTINFAKVVSGHAEALFAAVPTRIHREWRIATPALTMAYLLLHLWLTARARERPSLTHLVLSGIGFGLLFYVYPYYWTAAGAALVMALTLDTDHRRAYFWTGLIGGLIGLPRFVTDIAISRSNSSDWLVRSGKMVPVSRLAQIDVPIMASIIAMVALIWVWTRRRDLLHLWAMGVSGLLLYNHQVLTAIQIENFHWMYVFGPCLSLLLILMIAAALPERGRLARALIGGLLIVAGADVAQGIWLRAVEASRMYDTRDLMNSYVRYQQQRLGAGTAPLAPNAVIAGDHWFVDQAGIFENQRPLENYWVFLSSHIDGEEFDDRRALNAYLSGLDPSASAETLLKALGRLNWSGIPGDEDRRKGRRLIAFRRMEHALDAALDRFRVRYVSLPTDQVPPAYLGQGWDCLQQGPYWQLWERRAERQDPGASIAP
jgi:hypothetical protein